MAAAPGRDPLLEAARDIGSRLCTSAIFDPTDRLCNWMGRQDIQDPLIARYSVRSAALGPELYGGSAGVALFLIELFGRTGDEPARLTARAAIRRSVHYMRTHPTGAVPASFFAGHLGMAYVATRLMDLDPEADLESDLKWLVGSIMQEPAAPLPLDVISGCAGAIAPLLLLARRPGMAGLADVALRCGEQIADAARWENGLCHWEPTRVIGQRMSSPPVTGFAHGAAGLALALLVLYAHTGTARYRETARAAFAYEDTLFSEADGNWVDTRFAYTKVADGKIEGTFQRGWCHGAPGIALARLHAARLEPALEPDISSTAAAGIQTAVASIAARLQQPGFDATLCHGIGGISDIVLSWGELRDAAYKEESVTTARELVRRYAAAGDWPSGVNAGGPNPSFMIGDAGIGYHLLRLSAARSPGATREGEAAGAPASAPPQIPSILSLLL